MLSDPPRVDFRAARRALQSTWRRAAWAREPHVKHLRRVARGAAGRRRPLRLRARRHALRPHLPGRPFRPGGYAEFTGRAIGLSGEFGGAADGGDPARPDGLLRARDERARSRTCARAPDCICWTWAAAPGWWRGNSPSRFGVDATVLDPADAGSGRRARRSACDGVVGTVEMYDEPRRVRRDPALPLHRAPARFALRRFAASARCSTPDGLFYCDIIDYLESCRHNGGPQTVSKMDHCYWLSQETAPLIFRSLGFEIVAATALASIRRSSGTCCGAARRRPVDGGAVRSSVPSCAGCGRSMPTGGESAHVRARRRTQPTAAGLPRQTDRPRTRHAAVRAAVAGSRLPVEEQWELHPRHELSGE